MRDNAGGPHALGEDRAYATTPGTMRWARTVYATAQSPRSSIHSHTSGGGILASLFLWDGRAFLGVLAVAVSVVVVIVGPFAVLKPGALVKNTILFPLGLASVKSQADSPLLGHVLAQTGVLGHTIVVILLVGTGLAIAVSLVVRPPRDVPAAI